MRLKIAEGPGGRSSAVVSYTADLGLNACPDLSQQETAKP